MTWTWRWLLAIAAGVVAVGIGAGLLAASHGAKAGGSVTIGFTRLDRPAPAVTLPGLSGTAAISLANLAGEPIVINFWSSSCEVCKSETQALVQVAGATRGHVRFLGIDTDDLRGPAEAFAARFHIPYPLSFDPQGVVAARYRLPGLPMTFFLSRSGGQILGVNTGALTVRTLTAILRELYGRAA
jgi:cytochrome c biogenesis protein CcmG, thiol:disulfide interchange protein DsbE